MQPENSHPEDGETTGACACHQRTQALEVGVCLN